MRYRKQKNLLDEVEIQNKDAREFSGCVNLEIQNRGQKQQNKTLECFVKVQSSIRILKGSGVLVDIVKKKEIMSYLRTDKNTLKVQTENKSYFFNCVDFVNILDLVNVIARNESAKKYNLKFQMGEFGKDYLMPKIILKRNQIRIGKMRNCNYSKHLFLLKQLCTLRKNARLNVDQF